MGVDRIEMENSFEALMAEKNSNDHGEQIAMSSNKERKKQQHIDGAKSAVFGSLTTSENKSKTAVDLDGSSDSKGKKRKKKQQQQKAKAKMAQKETTAAQIEEAKDKGVVGSKVKDHKLQDSKKAAGKNCKTMLGRFSYATCYMKAATITALVAVLIACFFMIIVPVLEPMGWGSSALTLRGMGTSLLSNLEHLNEKIPFPKGVAFVI